MHGPSDHRTTFATPIAPVRFMGQAALREDGGVTFREWLVRRLGMMVSFATTVMV